MIESMMNLHKCSECTIRCKAIEKPDSIYASIHRWHAKWWPGWKLYNKKLNANSERA
jgi:hypothetical protein